MRQSNLLKICNVLLLGATLVGVSACMADNPPPRANLSAGNYDDTTDQKRGYNDQVDNQAEALPNNPNQTLHRSWN